MNLAKEVKDLYTEKYKTLVKEIEEDTNKWKYIQCSWATSIAVQLLSLVWFFATPWTAAHQASLSFTISCSLLKFTCIELVMPSSHLILCHPLLPCLQSFPVSGSFTRSQFFASGGQSTEISASAWLHPMNIQDWFPLGLTGWISLQSKGLNSLLQHHSSKASIMVAFSFLYSPSLTSIHDYWKNHIFD